MLALPIEAVLSQAFRGRTNCTATVSVDSLTESAIPVSSRSALVAASGMTSVPPRTEPTPGSVTRLKSPPAR